MAALKPLSDAQKLILINAAAHPDNVVFPLPTDFRARGAVRPKVLEALLKKGLVTERPTTDDTMVWRRDARRRRLTLAITATGRAAVGPATDDTAAPVAVAAVDAPATDVAAAPATAPAGKLGSVLSALTAQTGATLAALVTLTGWLPHTTRAALCRLRQRGYPIRLVAAAGSKAYHLDTPGQG